MTEGIIQQVFKRILDRPKLKDADREQLEALQQELIEKIKQEFGRYDEFGDFFYHDEHYKQIIKTLIGDNSQ